MLATQKYEMANSISLNNVIIGFTIISNQMLLFINYNIWIIFTVRFENSQGMPKEFKQATRLTGII
jgi:hypothetical protein